MYLYILYNSIWWCSKGELVCVSLFALWLQIIYCSRYEEYQMVSFSFFLFFFFSISDSSSFISDAFLTPSILLIYIDLPWRRRRDHEPDSQSLRQFVTVKAFFFFSFLYLCTVSHSSIYLTGYIGALRSLFFIYILNYHNVTHVFVWVVAWVYIVYVWRYKITKQWMLGMWWYVWYW